MRVKGVYTVEAVFVMSICIWILVGICYGGMYVHDRMILASVTNGETAAWLSRTDSAETKKWCEDLKKVLDKKMFLIRIRGVKANSVLSGKKVQIHYVLPVSWSFLKKILTQGKTELAYETVREDIVPAKYMWDREIVDHYSGHTGQSY